MKVSPSTLVRTAGLALLLAAPAAMTGCETAKDNPTAVTNKPLVFPKPPLKSGKGPWVALPRDGGAEYAMAQGDMEDVVSFYGFWSAVAPEIKTFDDMENFLRTDASLGFQGLRRGEVLGVPVLWFEKTSTEKGPGSDSLAKLLNARPRRADIPYTVRTRGVFMLQEGSERRFVTIACSRTSLIGEIGPVYEGQFTEWLTSIVANCFL